MSDLSGLKRLPIDFTHEGRVAVLNYVEIHLSSGGIFELPKVVLDTGLEAHDPSHLPVASPPTCASRIDR